MIPMIWMYETPATQLASQTSWVFQHSGQTDWKSDEMLPMETGGG